MTLQDRLEDISKQQVAVSVVALLVIMSVGAFAAGGLFTAGTTVKTDSGLSVQTQQDQTLGGNPFSDAYTFDGDGGTVEATSNGQAFVEVQQWAGTGDTVVQNVALTNTSARIDPDNGDRLTLNGTADEVKWTNVTANDGNDDFRVTGSSGSLNVTVPGLNSGDKYRVVDSSGAAARETADSSGTATFDVDDGSYELQSFDNDIPTVTNLEPSDEVVSNIVTLSADVTDDTLPQDNVTVTFRVDGNVVETTSIASAGEVNYTLTSSELPGAGDSSWSVTAEDKFGAEVTESSSFGVPGEIVVRNVSNTNETIPNVDATIYTADGEVTKQSNASGVIPLDGLPGDETLVMELTVDGYEDRTTVIPSVIQASDVFMLASNNTSIVQNRFTLEDPTGTFSSDSVVYISQPLDRNGTTAWRTIAADKFGVEGFTATLEQGQRYRIRIVSANGAVAQLGKFTAEQTEVVPLRPESPAVELRDGDTLGFAANVSDSGSLKIQYSDPTNTTDVLTVYAVSRFNDSNYLLDPQTFYGTNSLTLSEPVTELTDSYIVVFEGQQDGEAFRITVPIGPDQVSIVPPGLSQVWLQIGSIGLLLMVGGVFSRLNVGVGAITTSLLGGVMWYAGLMTGVATWATVAAAITFAVGYTLVVNQ